MSEKDPEPDIESRGVNIAEVPQADVSGPARHPLHAASTSRKSSPRCTVARVST